MTSAPSVEAVGHNATIIQRYVKSVRNPKKMLQSATGTGSYLHIGWASVEARERLVSMIAANIAEEYHL